MSGVISGVFWTSLCLYVMVLPIGETIALRHLAFAGLLATTGAWLHARQRWPWFPLAAPWAIYGAVALISVLYAADMTYSLTEVKAEVGYVVAIFLIGANWGRYEDSLARLCTVAIAGNLLMIGGTIWQAVHLSSVDLMSHPSINAGPGNFSTYVITVVPFIFYFSWHFWNKGRSRLAVGVIVLIIANLFALVATLNRQSFISLAFASLLFVNLLLAKESWKRRMVATGLLAVALATLVGFQIALRASPGTRDDVQDTNKVIQEAVSRDVRWQLWDFTLRRIADKPLTGGGFGREAFDKLYPDYHDSHPMLWHAHNMVLNKGIQMGLPGMLAFLVLWSAVALKFSRRLNGPTPQRVIAITGLAIMASVFMKNMTDDFFVRDGALLFWLLIGFLIGALHRAEDRLRQGLEGGANRQEPLPP